MKLKGNFYHTTIRPALPHGAEWWAGKRQQVHKYGIYENIVLDKWAYKKDKIRKECIREKLVVSPIEERWHNHT